MSYPLSQLAIIIFWCASLHPVQANPGANVPWITYEAENMTISNGAAIIGPPAQISSINATLSDTIPMEASGGKAVELTGTGQYVELTAQAPANSIVVRYCVPDTTNGGGTNYTISLYTNGIFAQKLSVTSQYSWLYGSYLSGTPAWTNYPAAGQPRNFFDEVRLNGLTINAGDTVRIQEDADDTAAFYVIDLIDLENVTPVAQPQSGTFLLITDYGADPTGVNDSSAALVNCISAAGSSKVVWMPAGTYKISEPINLNSSVTIQGAGMWFTTLVGDPTVYGNPANTYTYGSSNRRISIYGNSSNIHLSDFAIIGKLNYRNDSDYNDGIVGHYDTGSTISRLWVEHVKTGAWIWNSKGLVIDSCRFRDTIADGCNINYGMQSCIVTNCTARGTGDDCFAFWPASTGLYMPGQNVVTHCTAQTPFLANGGAIYGAVSNTIEDCAFSDIPYGCGILVAGEFPVGANIFSGVTVAQRCDLTRCGGRDPNGWSWRAALTIVPGSGSTFQNVTNVNINHINITNSLCYAVEVLNNASSGVVSNVTMNLVNISNYGLQVAGAYGVWAGPWNGHNVAGAMNVEGLTVNGNAITSMPASGNDVVNQTPSTFTFNFVPAPVITPVESGNILQLLWPANYTGWTLQSQTNPPGIGISTNWGIVSGSTTNNQFSTTLDNTVGSEFFRLIDL